jgi:preprotein translocase subunit SecG
MYVFITVLILITCILLILIVLIQNSKGGGLASGFSSSNQIMGVKKTNDFLEKATWTLAIALLVFSLVANFVIPRGNKTKVVESEIKGQVENMAMPQQNSGHNQQQNTQQQQQQQQQK